MKDTKVCSGCGRELPLTEEFFWLHRTENRFFSQCIECRKKKQKAYYESHKEQIASTGKMYREQNKEKISNRDKKYRENNREKIRVRQNNYNKGYRKKRCEEDPLYKLKLQVRVTIACSFLRSGLKQTTHTAQLTGLSSHDLTQYLLSTFEKNYGYKWDGKEKVHVDHIVPLVTASTKEEVERLCHYTNLQLLKAQDNLYKGTKTNFSI